MMWLDSVNCRAKYVNSHQAWLIVLRGRTKVQWSAEGPPQQ